MSYILIGSTTSPYVRKIRLCMHQKIPYEFKTINYLLNNDAQYLKTINPINKIPILLVQSGPIYDSRVIYNYLSHKYQWAPLSINQENILSAIDAALDSSINLFSLKRGGFDFSQTNQYITRQQERIPLILDFLAPWAQTTKDWDFLAMSLYSFLDWAAFREMLDLNLYPDMQKFLATFAEAPGVHETKISI